MLVGPCDGRSPARTGSETAVVVPLPGSDSLLCARPSGQIELRARDTGALRALLAGGHGGPVAVVSLAVSEDGRWVFTGGWEGTIRRWELPPR